MYKSEESNWIDEVLNAPEKKKFMDGSYTKKEAENICKRILKGVDGRVPESTVDFLYEFFSEHPHFEKKLECGFDHFEVRDTIYGSKGFFLVTSDGKSIDISYRKVLNYPGKRSEVMKAMRSVVSDRIEKVRNTIKLPFTCPITGEVITSKSDVHIDHYDLTFEELFNKWLDDRNLSIDELYDKLVESKNDTRIETVIDDPFITMDFYDFHNKHTHLRAVSERANLSVLTRKNIK